MHRKKGTSQSPIHQKILTRSQLTIHEKFLTRSQPTIHQKFLTTVLKCIEKGSPPSTIYQKFLTS